MGRRQAEGRTFSLRDSRLLCSVAARPGLSEAFKRRVAWFWGLGFRALRFPVAPGAACSVTGFEYMCDTSRSCQSHQSSITASDSKASGMPLQNPSHTLRQALSTVCLGQVTHHTLKPIVAGCHECPAACLASIGAGGASSLWFHVGTHATFRVGVLPRRSSGPLLSLSCPGSGSRSPAERPSGSEPRFRACGAFESAAT